jgi:gamma-butyrobetaine dioxygenase
LQGVTSTTAPAAEVTPPSPFLHEAQSGGLACQLEEQAPSGSGEEVSVFSPQFLRHCTYWDVKEDSQTEPAAASRAYASSRDPALTRVSTVLWDASMMGEGGTRGAGMEEGKVLDGYRVAFWGDPALVGEEGDAAAPSGALVPCVPYDAVMEGEEGVLEWLQLVRDYGFGCVAGVPVSEAATEALCRRIAPPRETLYSEGMWKTEVRAHGNDSAYGCAELPLHTDGCYMEDVPGLQCFHALKAAGNAGGASMLVDGFQVGQCLAEQSPEAFRFFCETLLPFQHTGTTHSYLAKHKVFSLDSTGKHVVDFTYNNIDRAPLMPPPGTAADFIPAFYEHVAALSALLQDPSLRVQFCLQPGVLLLFNNRRVLHGRAAFDSSSGRELLGCYHSREEWHSRLRSLHHLLRGPFPLE